MRASIIVIIFNSSLVVVIAVKAFNEELEAFCQQIGAGINKKYSQTEGDDDPMQWPMVKLK